MHESQLTAALEQINEIHGHMARGQAYRGYRPLPVAFSGALGLVAAYLQPYFVSPLAPETFALYWMVAAAICAVLAGSAVGLHFLQQPPWERRQILFVWGQFIPCLVAGGIAGAGIARSLPEAIPLLPGIWAIIFSMGIFASRPFLPRITGWVALYYMVAGAWLLHEMPDPTRPAWALAVVFCIGQCAGALMLYLKLERRCVYVED